MTHAALLLVRRRRPIGEPEDTRRSDGVQRADPAQRADAAQRSDAAQRETPTVQLIDGTAGAGRICAALLEAGVRLDRVRQAVIDSDASIEALDEIEAGSRFDLVALGSHLVNVPDAARRRAFVRLAARHLAGGGSLLLEHHPLDWAETAADVPAMPGGALGMVEVRRDSPFVSAVSVYDGGGRLVRQPFTARVLSEAELAATLEEVGLIVRRRLAATWLEAARTG